jgi:L-glyceraldehyde 3-phosphate reductase
VGRILRGDLAQHRDELIISTKAGWTMWPGPYGDWGSRKYLLASLDQSLKRLGLDYVDIFYSHRFDPHTPLEETLFALDTAVRSGKALYVGISAYDGLQTAEVVRICQVRGWVQPIIHQPNYSLLNRGPEQDVFPACERHGLGTIAFCPLAQGLLTDKYINGIPADSRVRQKEAYLPESQLQPALLAKLRKLNTLAQQRGQTLAQMALAWALRGRLTSALIGASRPSQITENAAYLNHAGLAAEELKLIDEILGG